MDLHELVERYALYNILRPESVKSYNTAVRSLEKHLPTSSCRDIRKISEEDLLKFRSEALLKYSPISFNSYRRLLRCLFKFALGQELIKQNPWDKVGPVPEKKAPPKTLSGGSLKEIIGHLQHEAETDQMAWFWLAITKTLYYTGIRRRQLAALRWKDVLQEEIQLNLRSEASKNRREWSIPICEPLNQLFEELRKKAGALYEETFNRPLHEDDPLFDAPLFCPNCKPLIGPSITTYYWRLGKRLGIRISPHRFRHTIATKLANSQTNIRVVQELLGHSTVKTTCGYILPDVPAMRDAVNQTAVLLESDRHDLSQID